MVLFDIDNVQLIGKFAPAIDTFVRNVEFLKGFHFFDTECLLIIAKFA